MMFKVPSIQIDDSGLKTEYRVYLYTHSRVHNVLSAINANHKVERTEGASG